MARALSARLNQKPVISDIQLPSFRLDQYVFQRLKVDGGVGDITWSLADGKLPYGIGLFDSGVLAGSPGEAGQFAFRIKAEDSFPGGSHSSEQAFTWNIGPADKDSLLVKGIKQVPQVVDGKLTGKEESSMVIDGVLNESSWEIDQPISKKVLGAPVKEALFGMVWDTGAGGRAYLGVKVMDGPSGKTPRDGIHIFLDGCHNKEIIYNLDDLHYYIPRSLGEKGLMNDSFVAKVTEIEGGYVLELGMWRCLLTGKGNWLGLANRSVYGFDIAVDEGKDQLSQQVWRGDAKNDTDTSHFGTLVMTIEPEANK